MAERGRGSHGMGDVTLKILVQLAPLISVDNNYLHAEYYFKRISDQYGCC